MNSADKKANFLELFIEVSRTITSCLNLDEVFDLITQKLTQILEVDAATIRLLDVTEKKLMLVASHGLSDAYLNRGSIDTEEPVFKALGGRPILIENAKQDSRVSYQHETRQEGIETILVVPIPIQGRIKGVLRLLTKHPHTFNPDEIDFVVALGEQCGIAIENARIVREQENQLNYFMMIHEMSKLINSTYELDRILDLIVTRMPEVMGLKAATIRFFESKGKLKLKAAHGLSKAYLERGSLDKEAATYYIREGDPIVILDAKSDVHTIYHKEAQAEGISSILAVPISFQGEVIGILRLITAEIRHFSSADINFAMAIAEQSGIAIQRAIDYKG
ncbi:MAG: GAF domain-containing protein [Desulfobacterales bacterium]|nr:GAF domain-containing protein [Desulfobacterales bacterium]